MQRQLILAAILAGLVSGCQNDDPIGSQIPPQDSLKGRYLLPGTEIGDESTLVSIEGSQARAQVGADGSWSLPVPEGIDRRTMVVRYDLWMTGTIGPHSLLLRDSAPEPVDGLVRRHSDPSLPLGTTASFFVDPRDGEEYRLVVLGGRTWMAQNLRYRLAGSEMASGITGGRSWLAGRVYTWAAAMGLPERCDGASCEDSLSGARRGICPTGWHLPAKAEWDAVLANRRTAAAAVGLWGIGGWASYGRMETQINMDCLPQQFTNGTCPPIPPKLVLFYPEGTNETGFGGLPNRTAASPGEEALWWQPLDSAERFARAVRSKPSAGEGMVDTWVDKAEMAGIRCIRD